MMLCTYSPLQETGANDPETTVKELTAAVQRFAGKAEQSDDLTVLAVRFLGPKD